ncbi:diiron oxygenase [Streptomyces sp. I05A-00742]|uniref:diiron oxygenase n=1 Tax=Streptomyces sp. I05A-00742 TaxID=2732853 RepID=UPI001489CC25|nr:diiron oxygenase [Streptomyces sp. I05A-00742]
MAGTIHANDRSSEAGRTAARLLRASAEHFSDPSVNIDWSVPVAPDQWFMPPELITLYGTPLWEAMDQDRRIALSRSEAVNWVSTGIWTELCPMRMLSRHPPGETVKEPAPYVRRHHRKHRLPRSAPDP